MEEHDYYVETPVASRRDVLFKDLFLQDTDSATCSTAPGTPLMASRRSPYSAGHGRNKSVGGLTRASSAGSLSRRTPSAARGVNISGGGTVGGRARVAGSSAAGPRAASAGGGTMRPQKLAMIK